MKINDLEITEAQLRHFLYRVFWKNTVNANLNSDEGCKQAATVAVDWLMRIESDWIMYGELERFDPPSDS